MPSSERSLRGPVNGGSFKENGEGTAYPAEELRQLLHSTKTKKNDQDTIKVSIGNNDLEGSPKAARHLRDTQRTTQAQAVFSGVAYCVTSCSMILLNKLVLSRYQWEAQISLMVYQNLVGVTILSILSRLGIITTEPMNWKIVKIWFPANLIFVGMLVTSFYSLKHMQVGMVTLLKNTANIMTAIGEMYFFSKRHSLNVWAALLLMAFSAICGGATDLSFRQVDYTWQVINCIFTAAYSLTLRGVMDMAKAATETGTLCNNTMVLYNNLPSIPIGIFLALIFNEHKFLLSSQALYSSSFWLTVTFSGCLGLTISFTSLWFLHQTGPTTYSLVGSLNKIPLSILGVLLFHAPMSFGNMASIVVGLFAGVLFAVAKVR